jgi:lipopolysaccharide/colanic/teichoic acid biosynthesis glycosyltransferase
VGVGNGIFKMPKFRTMRIDTPATPIQNFNDALTYAEQDIKDRWEWYKEKFKKGLGK